MADRAEAVSIAFAEIEFNFEVRVVSGDPDGYDLWDEHAGSDYFDDWAGIAEADHGNVWAVPTTPVFGDEWVYGSFAQSWGFWNTEYIFDVRCSNGDSEDGLCTNEGYEIEFSYDYRVNSGASVTNGGPSDYARSYARVTLEGNGCAESLNIDIISRSDTQTGGSDGTFSGGDTQRLVVAPNWYCTFLVGGDFGAEAYSGPQLAPQIPLPASALLLASGVLGLALRSRRRRL